MVAIFLVPVLAGVFLPLTNRNEKPVKSKFFKVLYGFFESGINLAHENKLPTIVIAVCLLVVSISLIPTLKINMMPNGRDDSVTLNITMPIGTPLNETKRVALAFEDII